MKSSSKKVIQEAVNALSVALHEIIEVHDAEKSASDERSEKWHESEKGVAFAEALDKIDSARWEIESAMGQLEDAIE